MIRPLLVRITYELPMVLMWEGSCQREKPLWPEFTFLGSEADTGVTEKAANEPIAAAESPKNSRLLMECFFMSLQFSQFVQCDEVLLRQSA